MFKNYLKVAYRNLVKNKVHTFINVVGLAIGLTCSILILLWVQNEKSIDAFHKNHEFLYKVYEREYYDNKIDGNYYTPGLMSDELKKLIPEIQYAVGTGDDRDHVLKVRDKILKLQGTFAGADFFKMFSYPLVMGTKQDALNSPVSLAISRKMANIFFKGPQDAIGKTVRIDNNKDLTVTAVFEDPPINSSRQFDYVINWSTFLDYYPWARDLKRTGPFTFVQLRPDANPEIVDRKLTHFLDQYRNKITPFRVENGLQRYDQAYLHSNFTNGQVDGGRIEYVNLFTVIAVVILLIACVNFMNLMTAQSSKRAKEIGVRKAIGAVRPLLILQFVGEALFMTVIAISFAFLLIMVVLPLFNSITQKQIVMPYGQVDFWVKILVLTLLTGLISGSYPAIFLSSLNPTKVLKGTTKVGSGSSAFRKGLVIFQFSLSAVLIIATIIISRQIDYVQSKNLGIDRENLIYVQLEGQLGPHYELFKNEALKMPGIASISNMDNIPTSMSSGTMNVQWDGKAPNSSVIFIETSVGYDIAKTLKVKLLDGRDFSKDFATDSVNYIINEEAQKKLGYSNPVGRSLVVYGIRGRIVGLLKDFHFQSLHEPIKPLIFHFYGQPTDGRVLIRTQPGRTKEALASLEALCKQINPSVPFTYTFSDDEYLKLYKSEQVVGKLAKTFAGLAIFISCLGLLGLAMFTAEQRMKEIGIRKVLGASTISVFALLSSEILVLVIISLFIGTPTAYYAMNKWLQGFAYRVPLQLWVFALAGGMIFVIALATVSFQSLKAALINPIKSLRSE